MDHYRLLEVATNATDDVIHAAYRVLAKKHLGDDEYLRKLNDAKDILTDDKKRQDYDNKIDPTVKGKVIGRYRIKEIIASGGFGKTYLADHIELGTQVCIKHAHKISSEDELLLHQEAKSIWDLRHYGIPNIRDIVKLPDGSMALVMSYIPGPTLAQIVEKNRKLDAEHVAWISERVLNILKYLHFHGVVHGDVKPQNIIVQPDSHSVVLVDYGLSAIRPRSGETNKGYTPYFAAPEQMRGGVLLPETDFYGLGMTMVYALGGDVEHKSVPDKTPKNIFAFLKKLIAFEVLSRPNWHKEDLVESFRQVRMDDFGRAASGMKPLKY